LFSLEETVEVENPIKQVNIRGMKEL